MLTNLPTVNKAARLERSGVGSRIHVSEETQALLVAGGKGHWLKQRSERVRAKGLGSLQTYWLECPDEGLQNCDVDLHQEDLDLLEQEKESRLIGWIVDVLWKQLGVIQNHRGMELESLKDLKDIPRQPEATVLDEVKEIISLPQFSDRDETASLEMNCFLPYGVKQELRTYVSEIAAMYRSNPFHNFEHATHVMMSVTKLLGRIVSPEISATKKEAWKLLHDHTYGITSNPLTRK